MDETIRQSIQAVIEPIVAEQSTELVELSSHRHGRQLIVRLLVDKIGGVTIQHCTRLNRLIGQALDASGVVGELYTLEVSSPGLDRPLISKRDFERAIGEDLDVRLREPVASLPAPHAGAWDVQGMLLAVQPEAIVLTTRTGNITVPLAQVRSAVKTIRIGRS